MSGLLLSFVRLCFLFCRSMRCGFCSHERLRHIQIFIASQSVAACVELPSFLQLVPVELCQFLNAFILFVGCVSFFVHFKWSVCAVVSVVLFWCLWSQWNGLSQRRVNVDYALRVFPAATRLTVYRPAPSDS